jgi:3-phosphoshikimate 1-carboxyvinyltransferase
MRASNWAAAMAQAVTDSARIDFCAAPGGKLRGEITVPGDKSISHRAVMFGALAEGTSCVEGLLQGEDVLCTLAAFRQMGVAINGPHGGRVSIAGVGVRGLVRPAAPLDMGNSGTAMRLMAGILAGQSFDSTLIGDASLSRRPMKRVADPLRAMGATIETAAEGRPPLRIKGGCKLKGIDYRLPMPSAQVKSCVLLAGLYGDGSTSVTEPAPTRDHTERMLRGFGYDVEVSGATARLQGGGRLQATNLQVPADISSAAFFLVGASIAPGSDLLLRGVGINPTRIGILNILRRMGADIEELNPRMAGGEPVADLRVRAARLCGIHIPEDQVPLAIDELPVVLIAAAFAEGETVLSGAEELRVKESDRIAAMAAGLAAIGIQARETPDGMIVRGGNASGGVVDSRGDHRIAMAFAIAALRAEGAITILDCKNVDTSFPGFAAIARAAGSAIEAGPSG